MCDLLSLLNIQHNFNANLIFFLLCTNSNMSFFILPAPEAIGIT